MSEVNSEEKIGANVANPIPNNPRGMFLYNHVQKSIDVLALTTNLDEPLYNIVTSDDFQVYARLSLRPDFNKVSRSVLRQRIVDVYRNSKSNLIDLLRKRGEHIGLDGRVVVSCDVWSSFNGIDRYVCVICHWVNDNFNLEKRVIGFEMLYPFDHVDVASKVVEVLDEFGLKDKVASISFDDGVSKEKCMEYLGKEFDPIVLEMFAHDRSYANAVDLCAQQVVEECAVFIDPVRELVRWFRVSLDKRQEFKALCEKKGLKPRGFHLGFSKDWKSTFDDLKVAYGYKEVLTKLYNDCANHSPLVDSQWDAISSIISLLGKFDQVSDKFRWVYDASCHLVIEDCITIVNALRSYESDPRFCSVVTSIRSKWIELFPEIPSIYCAATIFDARVKVEGLRQLLSYYYETLGVKYDVDEKVDSCKRALQQLYAYYELPWISKTKTADLEEDIIKISSSLELNVKHNSLKRKRVDEHSGELGEYLFFPSIIPDYEDDEYFEILDWWSRRRSTMHILCRLAKDILCTPISTRIPKSKLCPGKRVLDEKRSMLPPGLIQACICKKDWNLADNGLQDEEDGCTDDTWDSSDAEADA